MTAENTITNWMQKTLQADNTKVPDIERVFSDSCLKRCQEEVGPVTKTRFGILLRQVFGKVTITRAGRGRQRRYFYKELAWKEYTMNVESQIPVHPQPTPIVWHDTARTELFTSDDTDFSAPHDVVNRIIEDVDDANKDIKIAELEAALQEATATAANNQRELRRAHNKIRDLEASLANEREEKNSLYRALSHLQELPTREALLPYREVELTAFTTPLGILGEGAFGSVKALRDQTGAEIAVKRMASTTDLVREAINLIHLSEIEHVQQLIAIPDSHTLVTEFVHMDKSRRSTLERVLDHQDYYQLNNKDYISQCLCLTTTLMHIHFRGMLHNDIKTNNYCLVTKTEGKLIDFGLSSSLSAPLIFKDGLSSGRDWIAPEIQEGYAASIQSDLYSLGTLFKDIRQRTSVRGLSGLISLLHKRSPADRPSIIQVIDILEKCLSSQ
ncbi:unnamed protein product [Owenia fusiformis]|uniref:NEK6-subfamily protein kinase n=1 Tax=Owenia fusiformis TaxID=6347 RepID=A0A8S4Q2M3_OWEFU|nr:unnamed protein product [Owenia fusiformis]CAH1798101.1 unnamed protein product [Owenia fusiformis]